MLMRVTCPSCNTELECSKDFADQTVPCPICSHDVKVPPTYKVSKVLVGVLGQLLDSVGQQARSPSQHTDRQAALTSSLDTAITYRLKKKSGGYVIYYNCPHCRSKLTSPEAEAGTTQACPDCSNAFQVPGKDELNQLRAKKKAEREVKLQQEREKAEQKRIRREAWKQKLSWLIGNAEASGTPPPDERQHFDQLWKKAEQMPKPVDPSRIIAGANAEALELRRQDFAQRIRNIPPDTRRQLEEMWKEERSKSPRMTDPTNRGYIGNDFTKFTYFVPEDLWDVFTDDKPYEWVGMTGPQTYVQALCDAIGIDITYNEFAMHGLSMLYEWPAREEAKRRDFESFWILESVEDPSLNLVDALAKYIAKYRLVVRKSPDEPQSISAARTRLQILEGTSLVDPERHPDKNLQGYIATLRFQVMLGDECSEILAYMRKRERQKDHDNDDDDDLNVEEFEDDDEDFDEDDDLDEEMFKKPRKKHEPTTVDYDQAADQLFIFCQTITRSMPGPLVTTFPAIDEIFSSDGFSDEKWELFATVAGFVCGIAGYRPESQQDKFMDAVLRRIERWDQQGLGAIIHLLSYIKVLVEGGAPANIAIGSWIIQNVKGSDLSDEEMEDAWFLGTLLLEVRSAWQKVDRVLTEEDLRSRLNDLIRKAEQEAMIEGFLDEDHSDMTTEQLVESAEQIPAVIDAFMDLCREDSPVLQALFEKRRKEREDSSGSERGHSTYSS